MEQKQVWNVLFTEGESFDVHSLTVQTNVSQINGGWIKVPVIVFYLIIYCVVFIFGDYI